MRPSTFAAICGISRHVVHALMTSTWTQLLCRYLQDPNINATQCRVLTSGVVARRPRSDHVGNQITMQLAQQILTRSVHLMTARQDASQQQHPLRLIQ